MMCGDLDLKMTLGIISVFFFFKFTTEIIEVLIDVSLT